MDQQVVAGSRARIVAVCLSERKGTVKTPQELAWLKVGHGLEGDAHAGTWHRQVSLLSTSSIDKMKKLGLDVGEGSFAENLTVEGIDVYRLPVGSVVEVAGGGGNGGESGRGRARLEITQIGKECHVGCAIMKAVGKCVMPHEGVFAKVLAEGDVRPGDELVVVELGAGGAGASPGGGGGGGGGCL
jgi:cyclic pyranopterin phosphate synthase